MTALGTITLADGSTVTVSLPDDGGVRIELRPFSNAGATPATATLNLDHASRLAGLIRAGIGWQEQRTRERQAAAEDAFA